MRVDDQPNIFCSRRRGSSLDVEIFKGDGHSSSQSLGTVRLVFNALLRLPTGKGVFESSGHETQADRSCLTPLRINALVADAGVTDGYQLITALF